jgi:hypothetical protein
MRSETHQRSPVGGMVYALVFLVVDATAKERTGGCGIPNLELVTGDVVSRLKVAYHWRGSRRHVSLRTE